jgi:hypothetical protein
MRWGERPEYVAAANPATSFTCRRTCRTRKSTRTDELLECVLVRSDQQPVVVNLAIEPAEQPEVRWIDANHPQG